MYRTLTVSRNRILPTVVFLAILGLVSQRAWGQSQNSTPNDRARYLAALPVSDASPLKKLEQLPAYRAHAEFLAKIWQEKRKIRWDLMVSWAETEIRPRINTRAPLFYMFGGPDFLNAHLIYPDAPRYVLCGLEMVGKVPPLETLTESKVEAVLSNLDLSLKPALDSGFFVTKEMGGKLLKSEAVGVLPLIYLMVARSGNEIKDVQYVRLNESGAIVTLPGDDPDKVGARGVRIVFVRKEGGPTQELYYFRTDLSDKALQSDKRFLNYLSTLGQANSYLKATSYTVHTKEFSLIREFLLSQSLTILQDDSGIPYRSLSSQSWKITLYGNYLGPNSAIPWAVQPELKKAYQVPGAPKPLPFKSSYGTKAEANLLFAIGAASKGPPR